MSDGQDLESIPVPTLREIEPRQPQPTDNGDVSNTRTAITDDDKISKCVSQVAQYQAENWKLKKEMLRYQESIKRIEQYVATVLKMQNNIVSKLEKLHDRNNMLQLENDLQREAHAKERHGLLMEREILIAARDMCLEKHQLVWDDTDSSSSYDDLSDSHSLSTTPDIDIESEHSDVDSSD